jgi:5'-nucleotidase
MHLLLCNDDGYSALGIQTLKKILLQYGHRITLVAPCGQRSAQSHAMTFYNAIHVEKMEEGVYAVNGTPADCAALALSHIVKNDPVDFVISGINHGLNVGIDINYSGTVGAATEAAIMGMRAMAISADSVNCPRDKLEKLFETAAHTAAKLLNSVSTIDWPKGNVLNVNVPVDALTQQTPLFKVARSGTEALYKPLIEEIPSTYQEHIKVYIIGGLSRFESWESSEDVSAVNKGYTTLSFLKSKQSSSESQDIFENMNR